MADRIEWPSGLKNAEDMIAGAGRIEQHLNANGDPMYIGYAPGSSAQSHLPGWLIELRVYNGSNKLIGQYRSTQYSWNDRTLLVKPPISPAPVFGTIKVIGAAQPGIFYERGSALGQVSLTALSPRPVVLNYARTDVNQIKITQFMPYYQGAYQGGFLAWKNRAGIGTGTVRINATAVAQPWNNGISVVGQIKILATATGTAV